VYWQVGGYSFVAFDDVYVYENPPIAVKLKQQRNIDAAIARYRRALEIRLRAPEARNNLGNTLFNHEIGDGAIVHLREAARGWPTIALDDLGVALCDKGQVEQELSCLRGQSGKFQCTFLSIAIFGLCIFLRAIGMRRGCSLKRYFGLRSEAWKAARSLNVFVYDERILLSVLHDCSHLNGSHPLGYCG
jgi:tetratricopeptide (TPR) repeat protein